MKVILTTTLLFMALACAGCDKDDNKPSPYYIRKMSLDLSKVESNDIEFNVEWIPLIDFAFRDLFLEVQNSEDLESGCYQILLSKNKDGNMVSFLSILEETRTIEDGEEVIEINRNYGRCGPAVTYLFNDNGKFLSKINMR